MSVNDVPSSAPLPVARPRLIVAITGASGAIYGLRLLAVLRGLGVCETHLVVSPSGWLTVHEETGKTRPEVEAMADVVHAPREIGATIASGSFRTLGMVIAPCSMKTLAAVAHGLADNLITRAADVVLKERRRLVLLARETPLHLVHLRNMTAVTEMGGVIFPPVPAFYTAPRTIDDIVDQTVGRVLDQFEIDAGPALSRWAGIGAGIGAGGHAASDEAPPPD